MPGACSARIADADGLRVLPAAREPPAVRPIFPVKRPANCPIWPTAAPAVEPSHSAVRAATPARSSPLPGGSAAAYGFTIASAICVSFASAAFSSSSVRSSSDAISACPSSVANVRAVP